MLDGNAVNKNARQKKKGTVHDICLSPKEEALRASSFGTA
jgi:hypothetical protein